MVKEQTLEQKTAEVLFREKLVAQHIGKKSPFPHEPDKIEITRLLKQRVKKTRKIFKSLKKRGVPLSPYLEIGAEKTQRSMVLLNEFDTWGFATDISWESLKSADYFLAPLGFKKMPERVCCDAYHLPFRNKSFAFVFCFETLHHFPDPLPVLAEIKRVLAPGGCFYFDEEPIKQLVNLRLWRRPTKLRSWEKILKYVGILPFVSTIGKTETNHGVIEAEFNLATWKEALDIFEEVEATVQPVFFGPKAQLSKKRSSGWTHLSFLTTLLIALEGGGIKALCCTKNEVRPSKIGEGQNLFDLFVCPDCKNRPKLHYSNTKQTLSCSLCGRVFKKKGEIFMLLPKEQQEAFYGKI